MKRHNVRCTFAQDVFDDAKMRKYIPKATYQAIVYARENFAELSAEHRKIYANALCKWAQSMGVTRYTHWFLPLNNRTAEKRDSLYSIDGSYSAVVKFREKELKGEGDASSFPSGGMRQTFEARGITQWDCTAYSFIKDGCLCVPCTFQSFHGEALDTKTPLLKSLKSLDKQAVRVMRALGENVKHVYSAVGIEQEYFVVDNALFERRPDLVYTGRTLFGAPTPKGQEFNDHYFCPPSKKLERFMQEADERLWKLGIVVKTEHNEVAPHQCELASCYLRANLACDHDHLTAEILKKTAEEHGLACLLHEKPFARINGSGKHNNWSLMTDKGENLLEIGDMGWQNARFLLVICAVIKAVDDYSDLLLASISSRGNDCRLGGCEAPPRVMTVFLGEPLQQAITYALSGKWHCGKDLLPDVSMGTDRNRTSPFAFTGNKFEFRSVGSATLSADVNTALNTAVAESFRQFADRLEHAPNVWKSVNELISETFSKHKRVLFDGNNYSQAWAEEAKMRGLKEHGCVTALETLSNAHNINLFVRHGVLSQREMLARQKILLQSYVNTVKTECNAGVEIYRRRVCVAVENYLLRLADLTHVKSDLNLDRQSESHKLERVSKLTKKANALCGRLKKLLGELDDVKTIAEQAHYCEQLLVPALDALRIPIDQLEKLCPADLWPLPTYGQLLFDAK